MKHSTERILTTHVGSLPRSAAVSEMLLAKENGTLSDQGAFDACIRDAVAEAVKRQVEAGIDVVSDGEMSKIGYSTYIKDRLHGFSGDSPRRVPADLALYPDYVQRIAAQGQTPKIKRAMCTGEIGIKDPVPLEKDIANMRDALAGAGAVEGFMNAAAPGVITLFQPSDYHATHDAYLEDVAEAMRQEYEEIAAAGLILQLDAPDIGLGRHTMFKELSDDDYLARAELHVDVLNHALRNVPADRMRIHACWGNYEGPHTHDIPLRKLLPILLKAKPKALLVEAANPRHAHEWPVWRDLPDDRVLIPGVIDTTTNFVEHPELVAERIERFVRVVGRERVVAGTDCGFATFAGFGAVDGEIAFAKLGSLVEGAEIAGRRLR